MNPPAVLFTIVASVFLFRLPRQWAALPLIVGASYVTLGPTVDLGPFHFTVIRILVAVGFVRIMTKGERMRGGWNVLDSLVLAWAIWAVSSSIFHKEFGEALIFRLGLAYNAVGLYFLLRVFIQDLDDVFGISKVLILALIPIALEMIQEELTGKDLFSVFGGVSELSEVRGGKIRAQGPFGHSILAGTVGGVCMPMAFALWKKNPKLAFLGLSTTTAMVICSRSSGPIMTYIFSLFGLVLWNARAKMQLIRWTAVVGIFALAIVMQAPIYYLLARIDLTGSSTGYHRAILVEAAIKHFDEWWLAGTDYTLHWTPNAGFGNDTDITNHYIRLGVWGGLPLMCLFVAILVAGFVSASKALKFRTNEAVQGQFLIWALGCSLFAHIMTMMSVSYFDQSIFFLYLPLAVLGSLQATPKVEAEMTVDGLVDHEESLCHNS